MYTASLSLPNTRKPQDLLRPGFKSGDSHSSRSSEASRRPIHRYKLELLPDLLQLVGQGIGSTCTYLLLPPAEIATRSGARSTDGWCRIRWHVDEESATIERNYQFPDRLWPWVTTQSDLSGEAGREVLYRDDESDVLAAIYGPGRTLLGYLGIVYPRRARPELSSIRLLQDIVTSYLTNGSRAEALGRSTLQSIVDGKPRAALMVVDGIIDCANSRANFLLGDSRSEHITGFRIDDFISADEAEIVNGHIADVRSGATKKRVECTLLALDGSEHRVEAQFRPHGHGESIAVEVVLRERRQYRSYHDPLIDTISEAVWHVRLNPSVPCALSAATQAHLIRRNGALVESNKALADYFGIESVQNLLGSQLRALVSQSGEELLRAFVDSGYNLKGYEYTVHDPLKGVRLFLINATGTSEGGRLTDIWGSCVEISDQIELERKSVNRQEEQQERIGRDLHDSVAPLLTGVRLLSGDLMQSMDFEQPNFQSKIEKIAIFAEEATNRLGEIYRGLVPRSLEGRTLAEALEVMTENLSDLSGVAVGLSAETDTDVESQEDKVQLYRIVQEAINNALKHASATRIDVSLVIRHGILNLEISDDGNGFEVGAGNGSSLGLDNMRRRARTVGASVSIQSKPGSGTTVSLKRSISKKV